MAAGAGVRNTNQIFCTVQKTVQRVAILPWIVRGGCSG
jgi:hypothetical protein